MSRNLWIIAICLTIIGSVGIYSDILLSAEAYNMNPDFFIKYESNQEAIDWFTNGEFPFVFMISVITLPICILFFLYTYERHKNIKYANLYFIALIFFIYFIFWTRLLAGLTWYLSTFYICKISQSIALGLFLALCIYIFYYFPKNVNSFPFNKGRWINENV